MKKLLLLLLCLPIIGFGQFADNFLDGDFIANPAWLGNVGVFEVDTNNTLHLNDSIAGVASLVTQSQALINGEWIFDVRLDFSPSTSNYAKVYIASDMMDLSGPLNGVYVKIGGQSGSIDDISLYTQTGTNSNEIIDGVDSLVSNNPDIRVKVTRDAIGNWELFLDTNGVFFTQGTAFDNSITSSDYVGVYCKYTFTRAKKMWFDDFSVSGGAISQPTTYVPDDNFEQALINLGYDNVLDDSVLTANINIVTSLYIISLNISDLTGIEDFIALDDLHCYSNQLTSLDLTSNTALTILNCHNNQLTSLDISNNTALTILNCSINSGLTSLDVSQNTALTDLDCQYNQLVSLDIRNGNNTNFTNFLASNNTNLSCINVDDPVYSTANWTVANGGIDSTMSFSVNCGWLLAENLFFSEYAEGSSFNKYFEIYNPTSDTVDLTNYAFARVNNSPTTTGIYEHWVDFDSAAIILPNDVYVVAHPSSDSLILAEADMHYGSLSNGDDGFALVYGNNPGSPMSPSAGGYQILDWIGDWNGDPGSGWDVAGSNSVTADHTLTRKCDVIEGDTSWTNAAGTNPVNSQWIVLAIDDWSNIGQHISPCILIYGCMDSLAANYNPLATIDDSSCVYCNFTVSVSVTDVSCFGTCDGSASVSGAGGALPYIYLWSNGQTIPIAIGLCAGSYWVEITDANGCLVRYDFTVMEPDSLSISVDSTDETSAFNDGSAIATVLGGTLGYTYAWSNGGTTNPLNNLPPGLYTVNVTDANGCAISDATSVNAYSTTGIINIKNTSKTLIKVTDVLGQETLYRRKTPLFYIYDDGTVEKRIVIE